jgi:hypothetical protein
MFDGVQNGRTNGGSNRTRLAVGGRTGEDIRFARTGRVGRERFSKSQNGTARERKSGRRGV